MKIGICDDIAEERERAEAICRSLGYSEIYLYSSGEELLQSPELPSLTLLLLDIEMGGMSGIEVKDKMEVSVPTTFITFCTTHKDKIDNAFGRNVIFFLSKPLTKDAVSKVIKKAAFLSKNFFPLEINDTETILCQDVLYLKTEHKYTIFYTVDGRRLLSRKALKNWKSELADLGFCPVSRSAVINLMYYKKKDKRQIFLQGGITVPISRRYLQILKEADSIYATNLMGL